MMTEKKHVLATRILKAANAEVKTAQAEIKALREKIEKIKADATAEVMKIGYIVGAVVEYEKTDTQYVLTFVSYAALRGCEVGASGKVIGKEKSLGRPQALRLMKSKKPIIFE